MGFLFYQVGVLPGIPTKLRIEQSGMTIRELIVQLANIYQVDLRYELYKLECKDDGELRMVTIDGVNVDKMQGLETEIPAESVVVMAHVIAGG
ncbi:MAG: hypothetical protein WA110_04825 [Anaerolineaceae bacterium]